VALDPYDRVIWRGVVMDNFSVAHFTDVEQALGRPIDHIYQGSYNLGLRASAGTHDAGGALDFGDRDIDRVCVLSRQRGGAAWDRTGKGDWIAHGHVIVGGCKTMSSAARDQWEDYLRGGDALSPYNGAGDYHWRPATIRPYDYDGSESSKFDHGDVYVGKLRKGTRGSDSVRRLQYRLRNHQRDFANGLGIDGHYGEQTEAAVQFWQRRIREATNQGFRDGEALNNVQANVLFGERYRVLETDGPVRR